jgi:dTDP-4-amino-4,6-dideoxygalactose transaminase
MHAEVEAAVRRVLDSGAFILGPEVEAFEREWAGYCAVAHAVGVGSGLSAIELMLRAYGISAGDEVIVPAFTFVGTWLGVSAVGATPVPADVDAGTYNVDPDAVAAAVTPRTAAILAVHLFGLPAPMGELRRIADRNGVLLLEDAAQAQGAVYRGRRCGALGDAAAFSFYPTKNLGALGDAGIVTTGSAEIAARVRRLRNYGTTAPYVHAEIGTNSRLDEIQAAALRVRLRHLDRMNAERRRIADDYRRLLAGAGMLTMPAEPPGSRSAWHIFSVQAADRDELRARLARAGIETMIYYPHLPHHCGAYRSGAPWPAMPTSERLTAVAMALPCHPAAQHVPRRVSAALGLVAGDCQQSRDDDTAHPGRSIW